MADIAGAVFSRREAILLAAAAMTVVATLTVLVWRLTLDDAYITFRYARHLAEGYGLGAWNHTGEHAEGYSSPLWMLLLGGAARKSTSRRSRAGELHRHYIPRIFAAPPPVRRRRNVPVVVATVEPARGQDSNAAMFSMTR